MASFLDTTRNLRKRHLSDSSSTTTVSIDQNEFERRFFEEPDSQSVQGDVLVTETKTGKIESKYLYTCVCFTLNNYTDEDLLNMRHAAEKGLIKIMFYQHEEGINKVKHLQGFMHLNRRMRLTTLKYTFGNKMHFEKALGTPKQNWTYCTKEETRDKSVKDPIICYPSKEEIELYLEKYGNRIGGKRVISDVVKEILDGKEIDRTESIYILNSKKIHEVVAEIRAEKHKKKRIEEIADPYGWQIKALEVIKDQTDREVCWFYENEGCKGKSRLSEWLVLNSNYIKLSSISSMNRIAHMIHRNEVPGVIFDLPRSNSDNDKSIISYSTLEQLKDGVLFSDRYEGISVSIPVPKVIVFSNFPPDKDKLSVDRWCVFKIVNDDLIEE